MILHLCGLKGVAFIVYCTMKINVFFSKVLWMACNWDQVVCIISVYIEENDISFTG